MTVFDQAWDVAKAPTVYHGGMPWDGEPKLPIFFTDDKIEAEGYAWERGVPPTLQTADLTPFENPATVDDVIEASRGLVDSYKHDFGFGDFEVEIWPEIKEHSPYDGTNPYDLLYIPRVREALKTKGFDGVKGWDVVSNYEIPVFIPLDTSQFTLREPSEVTSNPYQRKYEETDS